MTPPPALALALVRAILILLALAAPLRGDDGALALLTAGGGEIDPGQLAPGTLTLTEESAFPILTDERGGIVAAAGVADRSRIIAFSHDGFIKNAPLLDQPGARDLVFNAIRWCGRASEPTVILHPELGELATRLGESGWKVEQTAPADLDSRATRGVYVLVAQRLDPGEIETIQNRCEQGMGLVVAATPWAFADRHPDFSTFPANQLSLPAGLRFQAGDLASRAAPFAVRHTDSRRVLEVVATALSGRHLPEDPAARAALATTLRSGSGLRGAALDAFLVHLRELNERLGPIVPSPEQPLVPGTDPLVDAVVALEDGFNRSLPAGRLYPLPAAADYPGAVDPRAPRVERTLTIDGTWRGWLSGRGAGAWAAKEMRPTGLYAAPGEVITVTSPAEIAGLGFEVVIGAYDGGLDNREKWERYPRLQRALPLDGPVTRISNALGGLITLRVPRGASAPPLSFTIAGAVEAPLFVAGTTDPREWRDRLRRAPAPWAELAGKRIIIAIPSRFIRELGDPDKTLAAWDRILETSAELCGGVDRDLHRAERIVFERQLSAGYMHSGYPVGAPQDASATLAVDGDALLREGNWGFFHEYGHNHQHDLWALPGTVETTCNLWSVYLFEELVGKDRTEGHDAIRPLDRRQRLNAYREGGRNFDRDWSMWTALETYLQVQEAFGWEPFQKVFAEYNALPEEQWPKTQQEKNDQWVIRLSRACGRNLAPFWRAWNLPLSGSVDSVLSDLPLWDDHPVKDWE